MLFSTAKATIYTACIMGIISTFFESAAPNGRLKKQLSVAVGIVTVLAVTASFDTSGFKLDTAYFNDLEAFGDTDDFDSSVTDVFLSQAAENYEEYFYDKLNSNGIVVDKIKIILSLSDDNEITVQRVYVYVSDEQADEALSLVKEDLESADIRIETTLSEDSYENH